MVTLITVAGTHGARRKEAWWRWGSSWWTEAERLGAKRAVAGRKRWSTKIEGIWGENNNWIAGGILLADYISDCCEPSETVIVAHSHGGQVAVNAIEELNQVRGLITMGTPVRKDMDGIYTFLGEFASVAWTHIYSTRDWWQWFGGIGDGHFSLRRRMEHAHRNIRVRGLSHADLHSVEAWNKNDWWDLIFMDRENN